MLLGDLTIKGVTKPVELDLEFDGVGGDPWGGTRAGFTADGEINRKDWGLEWNVALESGGVLVARRSRSTSTSSWWPRSRRGIRLTDRHRSADSAGRADRTGPTSRRRGGTPMKIHELGHLVLYVRDLERSRHFYRDVLGFPELPLEGTGFPAAAFSSGRTHHELLLIEVGEHAAPLPRGRRVGMYHFGLKIGTTDDELREALATLRGQRRHLVGATDHGVTHSLYIEDPDGNEVELYIDVQPEVWRDDPSGVRRPDEAPAALTHRRPSAPLVADPPASCTPERAVGGGSHDAGRMRSQVMGSSAKPSMRFEFTRGKVSGSPSTRRPSKRVRICSNMIRASSRARLAPRQKCGPPAPKATWSLGSRVRSRPSGSTKARSSRLAEA